MIIARNVNINTNAKGKHKFRIELFAECEKALPPTGTLTIHEPTSLTAYTTPFINRNSSPLLQTTRIVCQPEYTQRK